MSSYIFDDFKRGIMEAEHDLSTTDNIYKVALVNTSAFIGDQTSGADWNSVSANWDISQDGDYNSTGYTAGGAGLSGLTVSAAALANTARWDATDVTWASSTIDARGCVIYKVSSSALVCAIDFSSVKSSSTGDFTISWNSLGIINLG